MKMLVGNKIDKVCRFVCLFEVCVCTQVNKVALGEEINKAFKVSLSKKETLKNI